MRNDFDVIVVGARCAGAVVGFLLARRGYRVLIVDRATFPSDTLSTHYIQPSGVQRLTRWGLLEDLQRAGAPAISLLSVTLDNVKITGRPHSGKLSAPAFCIRRDTFDFLLLKKALETGAEVREATKVDGLEWEDGRVVGTRLREGSRHHSIRGAIVVGADGMRSTVAKEVEAESYWSCRPLTCMYYSYWVDLPTQGAELYAAPGIGIGVYPTNGGLTCLAVAWPVDTFGDFRRDVEGGVRRSADAVGDLGRRVEAATRVERFKGTRDVPNFFRSCQGPGWALVGDAGHHKDPITGQGMSDAFADAEILTEYIDEELCHTNRFDGETAYESRRNASAKEAHDATCRMARLRPLTDEERIFMSDVASDDRLSEYYVEMMAGLRDMSSFFRLCRAQGAGT